MRGRKQLLLSGGFFFAGGRLSSEEASDKKTLTNIIFIAFSMFYHFGRHRLKIDSNGINITSLF